MYQDIFSIDQKVIMMTPEITFQFADALTPVWFYRKIKNFLKTVV